MISGSNMFSIKGEAVDWDRVLALDPAQIQASADDVTLEDLYPDLITWRVSLDDPRATPENLVRLFQLTQLAMELKNLFLEDAEKQSAQLQAQALLTRGTSKSVLRLSPIPGDDEHGGLPAGSTLALPSAAGHSALTSIQDLSAAHLDEIQALRADLDEATKEVTQLRTDVATAEEQMHIERAAAAKLRDEVRFERMRNKDLELVVDSLNVNVKELKAAQARTLGRRTEDEYRTEIREKAQLVAKYLTEVQMLSAQNSELGNEVAAMTGELEAVVTELDRCQKENQSLQQYIAQVDELLAKADVERETLERQIREMAEEIAQRDADDRIPGLEQEIRDLKDQVKHAQALSTDKQEVIDKLEKELHMYATDTSHAVIDDLRKELTDRDTEVEDLKRRLADSFRDFELLSADWHRELNQKKAPAPIIDNSVSKQAAALMETRALALSDANQALESRLTTLDKQLVAKDREIQAMHVEMDRLYKVGAAEYARREIQDLRQQRTVRDQDIAQLKTRVNDLQALADELAEENDEFRLKFNLGQRLGEDRQLLARKRQTEIGRLQAVNGKLMEEIDALERERLELKKQVRLQALERGERALKLGLSVDQLHVLESLADRMRENDRVLCVCNKGDVEKENVRLKRMVDAQGDELEQAAQQVEELEAKLHKTEQKLQQVQQQLKTQQQQQQPSLPPPPAPPAAPSEPGERPGLLPSNPSVTNLVVRPPRVVLFDREVMTDVVADDSTPSTAAEPDRDEPSSVDSTEPHRCATCGRGARRTPAAVRTPVYEVPVRDAGTMCAIDLADVPRELLAHPDASTVAALYHHLVEVMGELDTLRCQPDAVEAQVAEMHARVVDVAAQLDQLRSEYAALQHRHATTVARYADLEHQLGGVRAEADELRTAMAMIDAGDHGEMASRVTDRTRAFITATNSLRQLKRKNLILSGWHESARAALQTAKDAHAAKEEALRKDVHRLTGRVAALETERDQLRGMVEKSVDAAVLVDAQKQLQEQTERTRQLEVAAAERSVLELECMDLKKRHADLEEQLKQSQAARDVLAAQVESHRTQLRDANRLEPVDVQATLASLRSQLAECNAALSMAESRAALAGIECDSHKQMQAGHLRMIESLQKRCDDMAKQNADLCEALMAQQVQRPVPGPSAAPAKSSGAANEDTTENWIEIDVLRQQLERYQRENHALDNANRRLRLLLADLQLQSEQTMLLGQAHQQITDLSLSLQEQKSKAEELGQRCRRLEVQDAEKDAQIQRLEDAQSHLRSSILLERQEHRLLTASLTYRATKAVSHAEFTRVKDALDLAMQYIRKLTHTLPGRTNNDDDAMSTTELRVENLRLKRHLNELAHLHDLKTRETERLQTTLTETERSYLELLDVQGQAREEHVRGQATLQDEIASLKARLATLTDQSALAEKLVGVELEMLRVVHENEGQRARIDQLRQENEQLELQVRRLDAALIQHQLHANSDAAAVTRDVGQPHDPHQQMIPLATAEALLAGLRQQVRQKHALHAQHRLADSEYRLRAARDAHAGMVADLGRARAAAAAAATSRQAETDSPMLSRSASASLSRQFSRTQLVQIEHLSVLVQERDAQIEHLETHLRAHVETIEANRQAAAAQVAALKDQIEVKQAEVDQLRGVINASVPRAEYLVLQDQLQATQVALDTSQVREQNLQSVIDEVKQEMVALTKQQLQLQIVKKRQMLMDQGIKSCESCLMLGQQMTQIREKAEKSLALRGAQIKRLEKRVADLTKELDRHLDKQPDPQEVDNKATRDLATWMQRHEKLEQQVVALEQDKQRAEKRAAELQRLLDAANKTRSDQPAPKSASRPPPSKRPAPPALAKPDPDNAELAAARQRIQDLESKLTAAQADRLRATAKMRKHQQLAETARAEAAAAVQAKQAAAATVASLRAAVVAAQRDEQRARRQALAASQKVADLEAAVARPRSRVADADARLVEELEDVKANYAHSVELNVIFEEELRRLGADVDALHRELYGPVAVRSARSSPVAPTVHAAEREVVQSPVVGSASVRAASRQSAWSQADRTGDG
ncbi:hypothetical protein AMAG_09284 [Allomyces macrogynus ATCC 38327]|uniref:Uncharacterized protein n=1 Tax=Allomyces macrogynus (strain ATCC 38327) TaxID=578462 RepID=A0A0L0SP28_ALLM3|nr:hypothetical protein AMAG_09284 [Allomyces macrogynus ATCC 38327]|eukprot:KNE64247.1 hypothetical protein AMAG_09284 [Allomyces macrogynus ATCC 38327]